MGLLLLCEVSRDTATGVTSVMPGVRCARVRPLNEPSSSADVAILESATMHGTTSSRQSNPLLGGRALRTALEGTLAGEGRSGRSSETAGGSMGSAPISGGLDSAWSALMRRAGDKFRRMQRQTGRVAVRLARVVDSEFSPSAGKTEVRELLRELEKMGGPGGAMVRGAPPCSPLDAFCRSLDFYSGKLQGNTLREDTSPGDLYRAASAAGTSQAFLFTILACAVLGVPFPRWLTGLIDRDRVWFPGEKAVEDMISLVRERGRPTKHSRQKDFEILTALACLVGNQESLEETCHGNCVSPLLLGGGGQGSGFQKMVGAPLGSELSILPSNKLCELSSTPTSLEQTHLHVYVTLKDRGKAFRVTKAGARKYPILRTAEDPEGCRVSRWVTGCRDLGVVGIDMGPPRDAGGARLSAASSRQGPSGPLATCELRA